MIDFPDSPTLNQVFQGPNGVSYTWNGTLWLVQNTFAGGTGDFYATVSATYTPATTPAAIPFNTVKTGNSGGYLNTATSRFTPPAGRYYIFTSATFTAQSATVSSGALEIRKNGVTTGMSSTVTVNGNLFQGGADVNGTFDANGSDYFEIYGSQSPVVMNCSAGQIWFGAFPLTGMQGPMGPSGNMLINGTGAPALSAAKGTLYINTTATTTTTRLYINTDGGTTWANFTASA